MRLIDAEALKKVLQNREECKNCTDIDCIHCFYEIIDNAPTVKVLKDTRPQACLNCEYCCYSEMNEKGEILIKCNLGQGEKCLDGGKPE